MEQERTQGDLDRSAKTAAYGEIAADRQRMGADALQRVERAEQREQRRGRKPADQDETRDTRYQVAEHDDRAKAERGDAEAEEPERKKRRAQQPVARIVSADIGPHAVADSRRRGDQRIPVIEVDPIRRQVDRGENHQHCERCVDGALIAHAWFPDRVSGAAMPAGRSSRGWAWRRGRTRAPRRTGGTSSRARIRTRSHILQEPDSAGRWGRKGRSK